MDKTKQIQIAAIGSIYLETNYLGLITGGSPVLQVGKEYRAPRWESRLGGSVVNFALQAHGLGMRVGLIGKVGNDEAGRKLLTLLNDVGIMSDLIIQSKDPAIQTSVDTGLVLTDGQNIQVVAGNANQTLSLKDIDLNNSYFSEVTSVYLGGFFKQVSLYGDYPTLLHELSQRKVRTFLDHGRIPVDVKSDQIEALKKSMEYVEGYFPNEEELRDITNETDISRALEVALQMGPKFVAVKLGSKGCRIKSAHEDIMVPGFPVRAISTVGAGDAFNAAFITQLLSSESTKDSGRIACATAAIRVSKNSNPTTAEVMNFLEK